MDLLLHKSNIFEWQVSLLFFIINDTKMSPRMAQISEHINSSNHKIYFYNHMGKMIVNLSNKIFENNNKSTGHINNTQKLLLMSIVDTPEKDVSNVDRKVYKRKIRTSLIKSSSTLFSFSVRSIYNIVHNAQNQRLVLKSFIPAINASIFPLKYYENIFSEKLINELHAWIENRPHVIHSPNVKDSVFVKINYTMVNKQKHILQI